MRIRLGHDHRFLSQNTSVCLFVYWGFRVHTKRKWLTGGLTQNTWASESTISCFMRQGVLSTFAYATFSMIWPWASALLEAMTACLRNGGPVWERPQPHYQYSAALCHLRDWLRSRMQGRGMNLWRLGGRASEANSGSGLLPTFLERLEMALQDQRDLNW